MKVIILTADSNGCYPVPATKGGAVATLVEHFVDRNNIEQLMDMEIVSYYEEDAVQAANKYQNVKFKWVKVPYIIKKLDNYTFFFVKMFLKKKKALSYRSLWSLIYYIFFAAGILKKNKYDKVILENNIPLAWTIKLSKYKGDYYFHLHNIPRINAGARDIFEKCTSFLCVSKFVAEQIALVNNPIGPVPREKIRILYNCVDTEKLKPDSLAGRKIRAKYGLSDNNFVVLFVGRISAEKGIDKLLKAVKALVASEQTPKAVVDGIKVLIVGSYLHGLNIYDQYYIELMKLTETLGDRVIFTGYISQTEITDVYNAADVAVLPSMWNEPAGLTMIEALACGVPVITTESGGIPEYVGGLTIVLKKDEKLIENIASEIIELIENIQKREAIIAYSRDRIKMLYAKDKYLKELYNRLSENR